MPELPMTGPQDLGGKWLTIVNHFPLQPYLQEMFEEICTKIRMSEYREHFPSNESSMKSNSYELQRQAGPAADDCLSCAKVE